MSYTAAAQDELLLSRNATQERWFKLIHMWKKEEMIHISSTFQRTPIYSICSSAVF